MVVPSSHGFCWSNLILNSFTGVLGITFRRKMFMKEFIILGHEFKGCNKLPGFELSSKKFILSSLCPRKDKPYLALQVILFG